QIAPVAMMMLFAILILSQTATADGSISGMYQKGFELAEQTYRQGAGMMLGAKEIELKKNPSEPVQGTYVNEEK
ncbi:MAG: hypothetical protein ACR2LT_00210, partial [Pyrinomonadaceae bacterium]